MTDDKKKKVRGNREGSVWLKGDTYCWMVTLGYKDDGKRVSLSGQAVSREAAHEAMNKAIEARK